MALANTHRRQLHERAVEQYGYVTTHDADALGIPQWTLRQLAARGGVERVAQGLYRFEDIPPVARDEFMEAVLAVGPDAHLVGDAVLALHDLALVNPRRIRVGTPRRVRAALLETIEVVRVQLDEKDITVYEGIPTTTVAKALLDSRDIVMTERLIDAVREATERGLLLRGESEDILAELSA